jgi:hypothetical protein
MRPGAGSARGLVFVAVLALSVGLAVAVDAVGGRSTLLQSPTRSGGGVTSSDPTTSVTSSPSSSVAVFSACPPSELVLVPLGAGKNQAAETLGFRLVNGSRRECNAAGYPTIEFQNAAGTVLRFQMSEGGTVFGDAAEDPEVLVPVGYAAGFSIDFTAPPAPGHCFTIQKERLGAGHPWVYIATDHRSIEVCGDRPRISSVYKPVGPL